jgi:hypothetical protein
MPQKVVASATKAVNPCK